VDHETVSAKSADAAFADAPASRQHFDVWTKDARQTEKQADLERAINGPVEVTR